MRQSQVHFRVWHRVLRGLPSFAALACAVACAEQTPPASGASPGAAAATDPATQGVLDRRGKSGVTVFTAHKVSDFDAFKKFFEDGTAEREKAGVKGHVLTRLDDGRVVIHLFAMDRDAIKMTLDSPELQKYLDRPGAPDSSQVWLAYDELIKLPAKPPSGQTFSLFVKMRMVDLEALRRGFVERQPLFKEQGVIASSLHHSVDQSDLVFLHWVGTDRAKLNALAQSPEFLDWLRSGGGNEAPTILMGEDVSRSRTYYADFK